MVTTTTSNGTSPLEYSTSPTKKEIIYRLFTEEKITFDEMWVLLQDNDGVKYVIMPSPAQPYSPPPILDPNPWPTWGTLGAAPTLNNKITNNDNS
jgi:hypothetical protein